MSSSRFLLVALALLGALLALPLGSGEDIVVDVNGNGDYTTIEDGLEAAEDGDLVRIWDGTYVEYNLTIEDQIVVRGNGTSTVVNASWEGHGFIVEHDNVEISHLKVESSANGTVPEGPWYAYFSGVYVNANESAYLHLESLVLESNYVGLVVDGQFYIHVSNSTITTSTYKGAHFQSSWYLRIDNSTISNNGGDGILCYYCNNARIYYSLFESNGGPGFNSEYGLNQTFYETDFEDNTGVGLYMHGANFNSIRNVEFADNEGGITLTSSSNQNEIVECAAHGNENHGYLFTSGSTSNYLNSSNAWSNEYALVFVDSSHNNTIKYGWYEGDEKKVLFTGIPSTGIVLHEVLFDAEDLSINTGSELLIKKSLHVKVTDNGTSDSWKIYDNQSDENREAYSGTHAMWLGDPDKNDDDEGGDGEYKDNWDFSFYTKDEISLGNSPQLSIATWYESEDIYDGGHVQVSTDSGESWEVLTPTGDYPCSNVQALGDEGYCDDSNGWLIENFSLGDYANEDIILQFRFASDPSVSEFEGWYIDDVVVTDGQQTLFSDDFENGNAKWTIDRFINPLEGADALVTDREGVQYASSYFGGSSPKSDDSGWLNHQEEIPVIAQRYYSSTNVTVQDVELRLRYVDWHQTKILNVSEESTRHFKVPDFRVYHSGDIYYNIQSAIENATSGDTVYAWNGTFRENLIIDKEVILLGNGTGSTIIDGVGNTTIRVTGKYATIANLSVKGATNLSGTNRYGIFVNESGGALNATDLRVYDNFIGVYFSTTKIWGSRVADSTIELNDDTGFAVNTATDLRIENCTINNNGQHGINLDTTSNVLIYGNYIHNNSDHGIVWNAGGTGNDVHHNRIIENDGDGIRTGYASAGSFTYNEIRNHSGSGGHKGIYTGARNSEFIHNNITGNDYGITIYGSCCSGTHGAGNQVSHNYISGNTYGIEIWLWAGSNNQLLSNIISESGRGISIRSGSFHTIENSTISDSSEYDFHITTGEHTVVNSTFSSISISTGADLRERELFSLRILEEDSDPFVDFEIAVEDGTGTAYASPHWGGSDDLTDSSGSIRQLLLLTRHWNGSATPDVFETTVKYAFGVRAKEKSQQLNQTTTLEIYVPEHWRKGLIFNVDLREEYLSLETAISEANSGDALQIWPGNYSEMVVIDKPLVITGNSTADVLLKGTGDDYVIDIDADSVTIRNLTVLDGEGVHIDGPSDGVTLEWLVIHNSSAIGLHAFKNDNLALSNLTVTDSSQDGILFYKTTSSVVSDCTVSNSGANGIHVESADGVEFQRISLNGNGESGFSIDTSDSISVSDSVISDNAQTNTASWEFHSITTDVVDLANISLSGKKLIQLDDNEQAHLSNLTLELTQSFGVAIELLESDSNTLRDVLISSVAQQGTGIMLDDSRNNWLINCTVSTQYGAFVFRNTANDNTILDSTASGGELVRLELSVVSGTVVRNSTFSGAGDDGGILLISATDTTLDNVTAEDNGDDASSHNGLDVSSSDNLLVKNSYFSNNEGLGAHIFNSDNVVIYSNQFDSNANGLVLWNVDNSRTSLNSFEIGDGNAVELRYGSNSWIDNNTIEQYGNDASQNFGIGVFYSSETRIHNNSISDSEVTGILLSDESVFNYVTENKLTRIENSALSVLEGNNFFARNHLSETEQTGITIDGDWNDIVDNVVADGESVAIEVFGSNNQISGNDIYGSSDISIKSPGDSNTFSGNTVDAANKDAILVSGSNNQFTGNQLTNGDIGFIVTEGSDWSQFDNNILSSFNEICFDLSGDYITLQGNHCSNSAEGAELFSVNGLIAEDNNWTGVETAFTLDSSANNQFTNESAASISKALVMSDSSDNEFISSSLTGEIHLTSYSIANNFKSTTVQGTISCDSTSELLIFDNITIEAQNELHVTPFEGVHLRLKADEQVVYATSHFSGSDATTGGDGRIEPQLLVHTSYNGSSDPESTEFRLDYAFRLRQSWTVFNIAEPHLEIVYIPDEWNYGLVQNLQTGEEYGLISDAVEDASEGDELLVWPSLYEESITVDKRLTITGLGPDVRVQGGFDATFIIEADGTVLQNLSIGNSSTGLVVNADDVILANLTISDISSEIEDYEYAHLWDYTAGHNVGSVAISADGKYIAAGSVDNKVYLFDKDSSTPLWSYNTGNKVMSVAISADGEYIAAGSSAKKVHLFDKDSGTPLWSYTTLSNVASVAISADGEYIVAGTYNGHIHLFGKDSSTPLWSYATTEIVPSVAISADGEYIVAGSENDRVYLFDKDSGTPLWNYIVGGAVSSVAISADGEYIAAGCYDGKVYLFDKDGGAPLWNYTTGNQVFSISISADGEYIAVSSADTNVYAFDKDSNLPLWSYGTGYGARSVAISADGKYIAAGSPDDKVYFFHTDSSALLWSHTTGDDMSSVAISADGAYIAAGSADYKVYALQHRPSIHGTGIAISTVVAAEVGGLQVRDITVRNTTSHGIATLSTASDFILERVHVSQTGSESLLLEGSGHSIIASSFSGQASFQNSASLMTEDTVFDEFSLSSQEGAYLENVSANYLTISGGSNVLLRDSSFATLLSLDGNSLDNRALDTTFGSISCESGSTLAIEYRTVIELRTVQGAGSWLEIEVTEDSTGWYDQAIYYTSFFGGGEPLTDEEGLLPELLIAGLVYNGSSTADSAVTHVRVQFNGIQEFNFTLTGDSTRVIWLNLPPVPLIESVVPTPVIQSDIRSPLDSEILAWWPLDEGTGTSVIDASGSGNNLTLEPTQSWAPGLSGSAVLFDGQFIYLAGPVIKPTEMTIELWFNTTDSGIGTLISDYHSADSNWNHHLYLVDGEPRFAQTQGILGYGSPSIRGGIPLTLEAGSQFNDGYWHHVAVVRSSEELSLWVDGEMLDSKLSDGADPSARNTWLGMSPDGSNAYAGLLDSIRISGIARHPEDFLIGGGTVILSGTGSDPDGIISNWTWLSSEDGVLGYGEQIEIGVDSLSQGSHSIILQVVDDNGSASQSSTNLVVMRRPGALIIDPPSLVHEGEIVTLQGEATGEMLITSWEWWSDKNGLLGSDLTIEISSLANGTHNITLRLQASNGLWSENNTISLYVNGRPRISDPSISSSLVVRGGSMSLSASVMDDSDSGEALSFDATYRLLGDVVWETSYLSDAVWGSGQVSFSFDPDFNASLGQYEFRVEAEDSHSGRSNWTMFPVNVEILNIPPEVSTTLVPDAEVSADGGMLEFGAFFDDTDGTVQQVEWSSSIDGILSNEANFSISPSSLSEGNHTITLSVQDNDGTWSETSFTILVQPTAAIDEPFFVAITSDPNFLIFAAALLLGALFIGGGLMFRSREPKVIPIASDETEEEQPQHIVEDWLPPEGLEGYEQLVAEYMARRREAYLAAPTNEKQLDYLHNNRERFAISSYFEVPVDPAHLLRDWALPENLRGNVHHDAVRSEIVERVLGGPPDRNYVIIGEPGVGKTVLLFELFDRLMDRIPVGRISTTTLGTAHEKFGVRLFYDDIQENTELVQALTDRQIGGVILSAREADWASLPAEFQRKFDRLTVPLFSENEMKLLSRKMLGFSGLGYDEEAIEALVQYAEGSPIYVWSMIREMLHRGMRALTASYIQENAIRGMTNYVSLLLQRLLKDGEEYRPGGLHALTSLVFLAETMEERFCHDLFYDAAVESLSTHTQEQLNDPLDRGTFTRALAYLPGDGNVIQFPHDTWVDVILGHGELNPFRTELRAIFRQFVDSGLFEKVKREVVPEVWKTIARRYHRSPSRQKTSFLALADTLLRNFQVSELKELGVDIELIREVASTYSHLPTAASLVSRIQSAEPQQVTKIINIQDSVSPAGGGHPPYRIEELYLLYNDGRLITGQSLEESAIDRDIMGSMLTAINDFVQDSFQATGELGSIDYGDNCILLERGQHTVLAVVIYGEETRDLRSQVANALRQVETRFSSVIASWDGDVDLLSGTNEILQPLLDGTREVSREMIDDYLSLQKVGLRASWDHVAGHVRVQVAARNYDSDPFSQAHLKIECTASVLELVAMQPEAEQTGSGVRLGEIDAHGSRELTLYFKPKGADPASLALRLDYRDSDNRTAGVTTTLFAGAEVFREHDQPDGKALQKFLKDSVQRLSSKPPETESFSDKEEETEQVIEAAAIAPVEEVVEVTQTEQVPIAEVEVVVEPEVVAEPEAEPEPEAELEPEAEPVDLGESGMDDLLAKLRELGPEPIDESAAVDSSKDKYKKSEDKTPEIKSQSKKKQKKSGSKDGAESDLMDDLLSKLKELDD